MIRTILREILYAAACVAFGVGGVWLAAWGARSW